MASFLRSQLVVREDAPQDLLSAYYAVAGLGLMGRELSPDERELLMGSAAVATEHAAAGYPVRYALYWYAMLARSLQWDAPTELRRSAAVVIAADQDVVLDSVWSIHRYAVWQDLAGTNVVTPSVLIAGLRRLQDPAGGFRTNRRAKSADLPSTYWAVSTLKLLGAINNNDSERVSAFVETCRGEYGYNDRPTAIEPGDGEVGAHAASLQSTGMAIELLTGFGRRPPITGTWSAWLPQLSRGLEVMQR